MWKHRLAHDGVTFPTPYVPSGTPLKCSARHKIHLSPDAEEIAVQWARYVRRKMDDDVRRRAMLNFWKDFVKLIPKAQREGLTLDQCDFEAIEASKVDVKRAMRPETKTRYADVDGDMMEVGNDNVGSAGVFMGRGSYNKHTGKIRRRIYPEDVTLNLSKDAAVPESPVAGHTWGRIVVDNDAQWLAKWKDPVTGVLKYVRLSPSATPSWMKTRDKFEVVRRLMPMFSKIVRRNARNLGSKEPQKRQLATCVALMCDVATRVGKPRSRHVFGSATLLVGHIRVVNAQRVKLAFIGKDGVPYVNPNWTPSFHGVVANLRSFMSSKAPGDRLFDLITPSSVNQYIATLDKELTSKVIRTIRANQEFERMLNAFLVHDPDTRGTALAKEAFREALLRVAELCNHRTGENFSKLSVNTALANYLDPRTTFKFAAATGVPPSKLMPRALLVKFAWASVN